MITLVPLASILLANPPVQGRLPDWTNTLVLQELATPVDRRQNAATNVWSRPAAVSLKVLLAERTDYRMYRAPLGSKIPSAFRLGITPQRDRTTGTRRTTPRSP